MRIVVDFLPLMARGGGLQNARNLWRRILADDRHEWHAWAGPDLDLEEPSADAPVHLHRVARLSTAGRIRLQNGELLRSARELDADVIFTPIGVPPLRADRPVVFGWHDSTIAYPESPTHDALGAFERLNEGLRAWVAGWAGRRAARVCVQTEAMASRLGRRWGVPRSRFQIVPNGPSAFLQGEAPAPDAPPAGTPVILVVAEPKNAKNLESVPQVARRLVRGGTTVRWVLTCDRPDPSTSFGRALRAAGDPPLDFVGRVPHDRLGDLYRSASVVFLPSWLESFSATYVEAMHFGVPLVTSDMDFAHAICGGAALYADPADAGALAAAVRLVLEDPSVRPALRAAGFDHVTRCPDWAERYALYLAALHDAAGVPPTAEVGVP